MKGRPTTPEDRILLSRFYQRPAVDSAPVEPAALIADQTSECPPHYWAINGGNTGICRKCGTTRQFPGLRWAKPVSESPAPAAPQWIADLIRQDVENS